MRLLASLALLLAAVPARAEVLLAGAVGGPGDAVLVGPGGQVYRPDGQGFRLVGGGGVATTVLQVAGAPGDVLVAGPATPLYRHDGVAWTALPGGASGGPVLSADGVPAVAVGRRVLLWSGGKLGALAPPGAPGVLAVLVRGPRDAVVASSSGELRRLGAKGWTQIPLTLAADDRVLLLAGAGAAPVVVATSAGTLLLVGAKGATPLALPSGVAGFRPTAAASIGAETLLAGAGTVSGKPALVVLAVGASVAVRATLPLADGDLPVALLAASDGTLLVATRLGAVHLRRPSGETTVLSVDATLPAGSHPPNPPALTPDR